jgi:succinyl-CoA synthetase beta subunit
VGLNTESCLGAGLEKGGALDLLECEGKRLLEEAGVLVPRGELCHSACEAAAFAETLSGPVAVKAQVAVGGRGKAGGVRLAADPSQAYASATEILGMEIGGHVVRSLLVEEALPLRKEMYVAFALDRGTKAVIAMLSSAAGVDVEELAHRRESRLASLSLPALVGWQKYVARKLAKQAAIDPKLTERMTDLLGQMWQVLRRCEATLVEINPLALTVAGDLVALGAKISVDDNSLFRHPELAKGAMAGADSQGDMARGKLFSYVKLDGDVGVLGNGIGLVMSTLDAVVAAGGRSGGFLDLGGGATAERIVEALETVTADEHLRALFCNVFGGITRCDEVAKGLVEAVKRLDISLPIVVRLAGTNASEGRAILTRAGLANVWLQADMPEAARQAATAALPCP